MANTVMEMLSGDYEPVIEIENDIDVENELNVFFNSYENQKKKGK